MVIRVLSSELGRVHDKLDSSVKCCDMNTVTNSVQVVDRNVHGTSVLLGISLRQGDDQTGNRRNKALQFN